MLIKYFFQDFTLKNPSKFIKNQKNSNLNFNPSLVELIFLKHILVLLIIDFQLT